MLKIKEGNKKFNKLYKLRHSAAHILAKAVKELYPQAKLGLGPAIKYGFYYDFDFVKPITKKDLEKIQTKMEEIIKQDKKFIKEEVEIKEAKEIFKNEPYKLKLLEEKEKEIEKVTLYRTGNFVDLCKGPHVKSTKKINPKALKLDKLAGAYWKGTEKNKMLTRIYGLLFDKEKKLKDFLERRREAVKYDHKILGKTLDLFSFHKEAPGFVFWHPKGLILFESIMDFWRKEHQRRGYIEVRTPFLLSKDLWERSGHWEHYRRNMYFTKVDQREFALKPMNCAGGLLLYQETIHSYRDFPLRMSEVGFVHRHERAGTLNGLFRVRGFTQDDAHIFCTPQQTEKEISRVIDLVQKMYQAFAFEKYKVELSTRPKKFLGTKEVWDKAEELLKKVLEEKEVNYKLNLGEGAFYGPKIDFHIQDRLGRFWQCGTIQLDFLMPQRFKIFYIDKKGKKRRPVMIHRTILGALERFMGILIEHYKGALPVWLSPIQVLLIPVSDEKNMDYCKKMQDKLSALRIRASIDRSAQSVAKRIREAELQKVPYILVIGDQEEKNKKVALRQRGSKKIKQKDIEEFRETVVRKIRNKE